MSTEQPPTDISHLYTSAEAYVEQHTDSAGKPMNIIVFRIKTQQISAAGVKDGATEWVTFTVDGLEDLAKQMTNVVAHARNFKPGQGS